MALPPEFITDESGKKVLAITEKLYGMSARANGAQAEIFGRSPGELILNPDGFRGDTTGYTAYDDGAVAAPLDGTGGAPATLSLTVSTVAGEILQGQSVLKLSKSAADGQGEGYAYDFSMHAATPSQVHVIDLWYAGTANFLLNGSSPSSPSDIVVYLYDVTNSKLIQPIGYILDGSGRQKMYFQSTKGATSYRLLFHVATTNALAYDFFFSASIRPVESSPAAIETNWVAYTPTITGFGSPSALEFFWRRVGDSIVIAAKFTGGVPTGVEARVTLPTGLQTVDTTLLPSIRAVGAWFRDTSNTEKGGSVLIQPSLTYINFSSVAVFGPNAASAHAAALGNQILSNGEIMTFTTGLIPIQGFGAVGASTNADFRTIGLANRNSTPTCAAFNATANIKWGTPQADNAGAYDDSTGYYTVKDPGNFLVIANLDVAGAAAGGNKSELYIELDDVAEGSGYNRYEIATGSAEQVQAIAFLANVQAGQKISVKIDSTIAGPSVNADSQRNSLYIIRMANPAVAVPGEEIIAIYKTGAGQVIATGTPTIVDFGTREEDSHGKVTTGGSWQFESPMERMYDITALLRFPATAADTVYILDAYVNGVVTRTLHDSRANSGSQQAPSVSGSTSLRLAAGQLLDLRVSQTSGGNLPLSTSDLEGYIIIRGRA